MVEEFKFIWQKQNNALFASISIEVEKREDSSCQVEFSEKIFSRWENALNFGCVFFYEEIWSKQHQKKGLKIKIINLLCNPVDTTQMAVVFTVVKVLQKALNLENIPIISFNEESGAFTIYGRE